MSWRYMKMSYEIKNRREVIKELEDYKKECDCNWVNADIKLLSGITDENIIVDITNNFFILQSYEPREYERIASEIASKQNKRKK